MVSRTRTIVTLYVRGLSGTVQNGVTNETDRCWSGRSALLLLVSCYSKANQHIVRNYLLVFEFICIAMDASRPAGRPACGDRNFVFPVNLSAVLSGIIVWQLHLDRWNCARW